MSKEKIGRIAGPAWMRQRADHATAVYNASYSEDMTRNGFILGGPWVAVSPTDYRKFTTHAEALAWAFEKAEAGR